MPASSFWYIGIDSGGSKTELMAETPQHDEPVQLGGPAAHLQHMSPEEAAEVIAHLIRQLLETEPGCTIAALCAGIAGAGRPEGQKQVTACLREALGTTAPPADRLQIVHDGVIALEAAFEGESGLITITGTGSLALARTQKGRLERAGGWGYLLGDNGSGLALGRRGLRAVAAAYDGGPATRLTEKVARVHGIRDLDDLLSTIYQPSWPLQNVAPLVLEAAEEGDSAARSALRKETTLLARQVRWLADRCDGIESQIAPLGGLTGEPLYRETYADALHKELPGWSVQKPAHRPVVGALRMARKLAKQDDSVSL